MTNSELKKEIKNKVGISVMVRNYNKRLNTISVWLFPNDRSEENVTKIKTVLVDFRFKRVDGYNMPTSNLIAVNGGEINALKMF